LTIKWCKESGLGTQAEAKRMKVFGNPTAEKKLFIVKLVFFVVDRAPPKVSRVKALCCDGSSAGTFTACGLKQSRWSQVGRCLGRSGG
jgi:hypothetical protein